MHKLIERFLRDVKTDTQGYSNPDTAPSTENHQSLASRQNYEIEQTIKATK